MSTLARDRDLTAVLPRPRALALVGLGAVLVGFLVVLRTVVDVTGSLSEFYLLVAAALVAATVLARVLRVVVALALAALLVGAGLLVYVLSLPYDPAVGAMVTSNLELLGGQSVLAIERSTVWALSVTPGPVFVTWYLGLRGWYASATVVAGGMLGYLVLTGDAGVTVTLLGVVGAAAALGFGDLASRESSTRAVEYVAIVLALMVLAPLAVSIVPGGAGGAVSLDGGTGPDTVEASLLSTGAQIDVAGSIELSPEQRFTVRSREPRYWRVGSFNRYTGDGWVRSGEPRPYDGELADPPGRSRQLTQEVRVESRADVMPSAWRPVDVDGGVTNDTLVAVDGSLAPERALESGESYRVTSSVPVTSPADLRATAGTDPPEIAERYTQLPSSTPDRVASRTASIVGDADGRYETAQRVQRWLRTNREYSLEVDRPEGSVADAFLFEMERGYCTYYATTMVTMLRTQDVPARLAVGYPPGEEVDDGEYVVRGLNSHAWVEVYFPGTGWVQFDPTPPGPRTEAEQARIDEQSPGSGGPTTPNGTSPTQTATPSEPATPTAQLPATETPAPPGAETDNGFDLPEPPSADELALGAVVAVGLVAGLRRSGLGERAYRWAWLRYQPGADPETDIERTHRRLVYLIERRNRPRRAGETIRAYLDAVDAGADARKLAALRERARYGEGATPEMAERARELLKGVRRR